MNQILQITFLLFFYFQMIVCNQEQLQNMQFMQLCFDEEITMSSSCVEGFLEGILVKTIFGYIPIEQIQIGDVLVGRDDQQEVISSKKGISKRYVRLLIGDEYVYVTMHQQFYLANQAWISACALDAGDLLFDGQYILEKEFIEQESICYSLSTQQGIYFIYPDIYVHNVDLVTMSSAGTFILGAIEISNPVTVMLGIIVPLSFYAIQYFKSQILYELNIEGQKNLSIEQMSLQNNEVLQKTREYYDMKRRALYNLYQDLSKFKNEVFVFVQSHNTIVSSFAFGLLSEIKPCTYNLLALPSLSHEVALSIENKTKLMNLRQVELEKLQQDIFDIHLSLAFHINELIEQRNQTRIHMYEIVTNVNEWVNTWNSDLYNIPTDVALKHYEIHFIWKELLDAVENKNKEVQCILSYYAKLKNHFFITQTTNLIHIFSQQLKINHDILDYLKKNKEIWWHNMSITEDLLRSRNLLTHQLVNQYSNKAKQYLIEYEKNQLVFAKKKKESMKDIIKEVEKTRKNGGGDPEKDPLQERNDFWEKLQKKADKEGYHKQFGKLCRDSKTKLWWAKDNAFHGGPHFKVFREVVKGLEWQFNADIHGECIMNQHKGSVGLLIPYNEIKFL